MEKNKRKFWTESEIEFLIKNYSKMFSVDLSEKLNRSVLSINMKANKLGLSKSKEHKSKCISKRNKMVNRNLTKNLLCEIAKNYKSRSEFQKKDPSAYSTALKKGIINEICSHMINKSFSIPEIILKDIISKIYKTKNIIHNDRKILKPYEIDVFLPDYNLGFEYNGKGWHEDNKRDKLKNDIALLKNINLITICENNRNYEVDIKNQLISNIKNLKIKISIDEIRNIVIDDPYSKVYDIDVLIKITKSYDNFTHFYKNENSTYVKILKLGIIDELTKHMCCKRRKREINEVIEVIKKYQYLKDLILKDSGTYQYIKKNNLDYLLSDLIRLKN